MPVIRFVREGRDVECYPGENLREVALREGVELYGLKGKLGNCGGCGQCITCFVEVVEGTPAAACAAFPGFECVSGKRVALAYLRCLFSGINGQVIRI